MKSEGNKTEKEQLDTDIKTGKKIEEHLKDAESNVDCENWYEAAQQYKNAYDLGYRFTDADENEKVRTVVKNAKEQYNKYLGQFETSRLDKAYKIKESKTILANITSIEKEMGFADNSETQQSSNPSKDQR